MWLLRLVTWDGLLPAAVWVSPAVARAVFKNNHDGVEFVAVMAPIVALFLRYHIGAGCIRSNYCRDWTRRLQFCALCIGLVALLLIDCFIILMHQNLDMFATDTDRLCWAILGSIYLGSMAIALYPGRRPPDEAASLYDEFLSMG